MNEPLELSAIVRSSRPRSPLSAGGGLFQWRLLLGGYSIECALKACIAKQTQAYDFPDKKLVNEAMRKAGMRFLTQPDIFLRNMEDPFIQDLRQSFSNAGDVYGMRLGGQKFGGQYIEDAFVYRIR